MSASNELTEITGKFLKNIFRSDDNSYCVSLYIHKGETFTVVGNDLPEVSYPVTFAGRWKINAQYGKQFVAEMLVNNLPVEADHITQFIASLRTGIGSKRAALMLHKVGTANFWSALEEDPVQFTEIRGIKLKQVMKLRDAVAEMTQQTGLLKYFAGDLSMTSAQFKKIQRYFRDNPDEILSSIKANPFLLIHCGYPFRELDHFCSRHTAFPVDEPKRLYAATYQILMDARDACHVALPYQEALGKLTDMVAVNGSVSCEALEHYLQSATATEQFVLSNGLIYLPRAYFEETGIANFFQKRLTAPDEALEERKFQSIMADYAKKKGFSLSPAQVNAVRTALVKHILVITGGPGTGKSTILDAILYCWKELYNTDWLLMAPTGKASVRMTQTTGQGASTIHSALGLTIGSEDMAEADDRANPIYSSLIVVDECSMLDQTVMSSLAFALNSGSNPSQHLVLVGDPDQLPSVGWGNVLADIIESGTVPVCRLDTIYRQGEESPIIANAQRMLSGITELDCSSSRSFRRFNYCEDGKNMESACLFYKRCVDAYGVENVMLLSPYRKVDGIGTNDLNKRLQEVMNPSRGQPEIRAFGKCYRESDRVIQLKNTEKLSNGDIGTIISVDEHAPEDQPCIVVRFENGVENSYYREGLVQLDHAYALTVHKSQGSQSKVVIVVLPCSLGRRMRENLRCNLLYTAITRSQENVALFASLESIASCIANNKKDLRHTGLVNRLRAITTAYSKIA